MTSLPSPPQNSSSPPSPRILSAPSPPNSLSGPSVPKSRPPLGQPGRSFVVWTPQPTHPPLRLILRVPSHRASSSDAVAWGELPCSFFEVSERVPEQPTPRRRTTHPIRKIPTTAMRCPRRTTIHPPSLCLYFLLLAPLSMPHNKP